MIERVAGQRFRRRRRAAFTVVAALVLVVATLAPGLVAAGSALALLRIPLEAVVALALLAVVPLAWVRRVIAALLSVLVVAAILSAGLDRGFEGILGRRFDASSDWPYLGDALGVLRDSVGGVLEVLILIGLAVAIAAALLGIAWALLRIDAVVRRHRRVAVVSGASVTAIWAILALVGVDILPGLPLAADDEFSAGAGRTAQAYATANSLTALQRAEATDAFADVPASQLLTGLKGKDVVVAFIESYGQVAVQHTSYSIGVDSVLRQGTADLAKAGYSERSAFLTSPTFGGVSWLAHSTLQTGLWIDSQQKYDTVTSGSRFTLSDAFRKAGWYTVSDVPSDAAPWSIGSTFYHYDAQLDSQNVGYVGPRFSYARIPDQYTWAHFQQTELAKPHPPLFAEIDFVSSHTPWTPLPKLVPWDKVGDGSVYDPQPAEGLTPDVVWQDPKHVQQLYGRSVEYSLGSMFSFLTTFHDPNLVLVVLGDHQPANVVSGADANHRVPISVISQDPTVMDRIAGWNWEPGMLPSPSAPLWRMSAFRDRFLRAFG